MDIVEQAARLVDPEAFSEGMWLDGKTGKPYDFGELERARKKYYQSRAICRAIDVLKLALKTPNLRQQLIKNETDGWKKLGIPEDILLAPEVKETIARKFAE